MGVSMLARGCLHQAHLTFQEATAVLKQVCHPCIHHSLEGRLKHAIERLANPQSMEIRGVEVNVLTCDPSMPPTGAFLAPLQGAPAVTPIKIDVMDPDLIERTDMSIETSIIIFNCGITSFLISHASPKGPKCQALLSNSFQFFRLTAKVSSCFRCPDDEVTKSYHLVLAFLAVHHLIQVVRIGNGERREHILIECNVDYFTQLRREIKNELQSWQRGTMLWMLLSEPKIAASA